MSARMPMTMGSTLVLHIRLINGSKVLRNWGDHLSGAAHLLISTIDSFPWCRLRDLES